MDFFEKIYQFLSLLLMNILTGDMIQDIIFSTADLICYVVLGFIGLFQTVED